MPLGEDTATQVLWWRVMFFSGLSDYLSVETYSLGTLTSALVCEYQVGTDPAATYALIGLVLILATISIAEAFFILRKSSVD